jgi:hypothetical protein
MNSLGQLLEETDGHLKAAPILMMNTQETRMIKSGMDTEENRIRHENAQNKRRYFNTKATK